MDETAGRRFWQAAAARYGGAGLLYAALAVYLYLPYVGKFSGHQFLFLLNPVLAAGGAYALSKRWVHEWTPSVLAGAIYGFSPFALSFGTFQQPVAEISFVMIPWLFLPSVFWHKHRPPDALRWAGRTVFVLLPFAAVAGLFWAAAQPWAGPHFLMPARAALTPAHAVDIVFPLYQKGPHLTFGLYHAALIVAAMGLCVLVRARRVAVFLPVAAAAILCVSEPVLGVPPIIWAAVIILFAAILAGLGCQSLLWAGRADSGWVLACAVAASVLAALFAGLAYRRLFAGGLLQWTALMYALAAAAMWILLFFARTGLRWKPVKWAVLTAAVALDLVLSARYLIDKLF